jgi:hypothetical protein
MLFGKPKPTVTPEDQDWIEEAFLWFEAEYTREYLKTIRIIEPTREFFPIDFKGTEQNASDVTTIVCNYMNIRNIQIDLHYFSDKPLELAPGITTTQREKGFEQRNRNVLGTYSETGERKYSIGLELDVLKDPINLIATISHELSHLLLLGEGRIKKNDETLTDLNCIALGFGIFTCNNIFTFNQWHNDSHQGWQAQTRGYIPEQVATYALALLVKYQQKEYTDWVDYLSPSSKKMFKRNMKYLASTADEIKFK